MAMYTMQVRTICEQYYLESNPNLSVDAVKMTNIKTLCQAVWDKVFDFDFPMYETDSKRNLCTLILMHYYMREIGLETVGLWKLHLESRMNEIMPYYVDLSKAVISQADALINQDVTETSKRSGNENTDGNRKKTGNDSRVTNGTQSTESDHSLTGTSNKDNDTQELYSDTPQDGLQNVINGTYLTNASVVKSTDGNSVNQQETNDSSVTVNSDDSGTRSENEDTFQDKEYLENITKNIKGFNGDKVDVLMRYRETLLQIPRMIIRDLSDLFISIL